MRSLYLFIFVATLALSSCKKYSGNDYPPPPPPPPPVPVLLKDVVLSNVPSPFYHFEYNTSGKVQKVSYASGLENYTVVYNGDKIKEINNSQILDLAHLEYAYDDQDRVSLVSYVDPDGTVERKILLTYTGDELTKLERQLHFPAGFVTDKIMSFQYDGQKNLTVLTTHHPAIMGQDESTYSDLFEQYDNKINVDGFSLIHDEFFDLLVLLPGVKLQKNNPGKLRRIGDGINFTVDYTYTYNEKNLPLVKSGQVLTTNGANAGQTSQISSTFSYY